MISTLYLSFTIRIDAWEFWTPFLNIFIWPNHRKTRFQKIICKCSELLAVFEQKNFNKVKESVTTCSSFALRVFWNPSCFEHENVIISDKSVTTCSILTLCTLYSSSVIRGKWTLTLELQQQLSSFCTMFYIGRKCPKIQFSWIFRWNWMF